MIGTAEYEEFGEMAAAGYEEEFGEDAEGEEEVSMASLRQELLELDEKLSTLNNKQTGGLMLDSFNIYYSLSQHDGNPSKYRDLGCFLSNNDEVEKLIVDTESLLVEGPRHVKDLYCYRSISKAIPLLHNESDEERKLEFYLNTFNVLVPHMKIITDLAAFAERASDQFKLLMERVSLKKETMSDTLFDFMVNLLDLMAVLDHLKDTKPYLQNDFALYKRALHMARAKIPNFDRLNQEKDMIQFFLCDPSCPKGVMVNKLHGKVSSMRSGIQTLMEILSMVTAKLTNDDYFFPEERWKLVRTLPFVILLMDKTPQDNFNIFKAKKVLTPQVARILRKNPVVPVFGDVHLNIGYILQQCPNYDGYQNGTSSGEALFVEPSKAMGQIDLKHTAKEMRGQYEKTLASITALLPRINDICDAGAADPLSNREDFLHGNVDQALVNEVAMDTYQITYDSLKLLSSWKDFVYTQSALRFACPATKQALEKMGVQDESAVNDYERAMRYNYSESEFSALINIIVMIKSLATTIYKEQYRLVPFLQGSIYSQLQAFLKNDIGDLLSKADAKKKRKLHQTLLDMQRIGTDIFRPSMDSENNPAFSNLQQQQQENNNRSKLQQQGGGGGGGGRRGLMALAKRKFVGTSARNMNADSTEIPTSPENGTGSNPALDPGATSFGGIVKCVTPSKTQLEILRCIARSLLADGLEGLGAASTGGFTMRFTKNNQKGSVTVNNLAKFVTMLNAAPALLDLMGSIQDLSNLGELWLREFYLDITKSVQFPMEMSLPWILTKFVVENPSTEMMDSLFHTLDLYNDASNLVLFTLEQQYLYDEVEAEVNAAMNQLLESLPNEIYAHFKSLAAYQSMETKFKNKLEKLKRNNNKLAWYGLPEPQRYDLITAQRHFQLLGRDVDFGYHISQRLNKNLYEDVQVVLDTFRSGSLCGIVEFRSQLHVLQHTYQCLNELSGVVVDAWEDIVSCTINKRAALHIAQELETNIIPFYSYNETTERFVAFADIIDSEDMLRHRVPRPFHGEPHFGYGSTAAAWFELLHKRERGFLGKLHFDSIVRTIGRDQVASVMQYLLDQIMSKIHEKLVPSAEKLATLHLTAPGYGADAETCLQCFEKATLEPSVAQSVLQAFREIGNGLVVLGLMENALVKMEIEQAIDARPLMNPLQRFSQSLGSKKVSLDITNGRSPVLKNILHSLQAELCKFDKTILSGLVKIWSSAQFTLLIGEQPLEDYGDAIGKAGCTILHLIGHRYTFELEDFSYKVLYAHQRQRDVTLSKQVQHFIDRVTRIEKINESSFAELEQTVKITNKADQQIIFHPPKYQQDYMTANF